MAGASDYLELKILDHVFGGATYSQPATLYLALFTANPTDAGGGTEVTGGSYARQTVTFGAAAAGQVANDAIVTFSDMPACSVTGFGIYDASTAGNLLNWDAVDSAPVGVSAGQPVEFGVGDLTVSLD